MSAESLLNEILDRGARIRAEGDELVLRAPKGALADLREAVRAEKGPLLSLLGQHREHVRTSFAQERLWFLQRLEPEDASYHVHLAWRFEGRLDRGALERALGAILERHEPLRTLFPSFEGRPCQVVLATWSRRLGIVDLSAVPEASRPAEAGRRLLREARRPFRLHDEPAVRFCLLRFADEEHVLFVNLHHVLTDAWSMGIFESELRACYQAFSRRLPPRLAELPCRYADYALRQRRDLRGERLAEQLAYWRTQLSKLPARELATDFPRPKKRSSRGAALPLVLDAGRTASLKALGREAEASLFMTLLASFLALLHRFTGSRHPAVGSVTANRHRYEVEDLIGFFVNTLVLTTGVAGERSFARLLAAVRETALQAFRHQDVPFEKLVEELAAERDPGRSPFFQVMLVLVNTPPGDAGLTGLRVSPFPLGARSAHFDLTLSFTEREGRLVGDLCYAAELFCATTVARLGRSFATLLAAAAEDPSRPLAHLPLLDAGERHQLLAEWSGTARPPRGEEPLIHRLVEAQAKRVPDATALVCDGSSLSYRELDVRAERLAGQLRRRGVGPESRVGVLLERSAELVVSLLAILKAGGAYVPLDPGLPEERLGFLIADAGVELVLTGGEPASPPPSGEERRRPAHADSLAYVTYTSGSTGEPKGVAVTHRAVARLVRGNDFARFAEDEVFLHLAPASFDAATLEIWGPLANGARLVIPPPGPLQPSELGRLLQRHRVTTLWLTAGLFHVMAEERPADLGGLRQLLAGGDVLSPDHVARVIRELAHGVLINGYGPTESTTFTSCHPMRKPPPRGPVPIGRPIRGTSVHVVDAALVPVGAGVPGELVIGGAGLARGYWRRPRQTAERFVPDPTGSAGGRLYRSGDRVRFLPDGSLEMLGRLDDQVKIRGFRVEPREVEVVLGCHPAVRAAVVVARTPEDGGAGSRFLAAYYVPAPAPPEPAALRAFLAERLPAYMVPRHLEAVEGFPLSANGKVDRRALGRRTIAAPSPEAPLTPPRTPTEEVLLGIWGELLPRRAIGVRGHFFELGGHSLLATQLASRVRRAFGVELPLRRVFEQPRLDELAREIDRLRRAGTGKRVRVPPILPAGRDPDRPLPLSFAQQRLWFLQQLEPESPVYNIPDAHRLQGELDEIALEAAFAEVLRRHEVLRTRFPDSRGRPHQLIEPAAGFRLPRLDLTGLAPPRRTAAARALLAAEAARPFDLARERPLRALLLRLAAAEHVLFWNVHHVVFDGWSQGVLHRELSTLYRFLRRRQPPKLAEPAIQYADFAVWQREYLGGEVLAAQLGYWRRQLEGLEVPELPADRPRPGRPAHAGAGHGLALPAELTRRLKERSVAAGASLFMTLVTAFAVLLHRLTGAEEAVVGVPVANRHHRDVEELIGFFVNTLVLRIDLSPDRPSFRELLERVRERTFEAYDHQDLPFEKLVEELAPERDLSRSPLFQVMFILQNAPGQALALQELQATAFDFRSRVAHFDLMASLCEARQGIRGSISYDTGLFDATTIARFVRCYEAILADAVADPSRPIDRLTLLGEGERHQLLVEWNDTAGRPAARSLLPWFEAQARRTPEAVAATDAMGRIRYGELADAAGRLSRHLVADGVRGEDVVALFAERGIRFLAAFLGLLKAGAAYLPLDPQLPERRLAELVEQSAARRIVVSGSLLGRLQAVLDALARPPPYLVLEELLARDAPRVPQRGPAAPEQLAAVLYTSGSTGKPKGAMITHQATCNHVEAKIRDTGLGPSDVLPQTGAQSWVIALWQLLAPLTLGGRVHFVAPEVTQDPAALLDELARAGATGLEVVPSYMGPLLDELDRHDGHPALARLRWLMPTGEPLVRGLARRWLETCPETPLVNTYGLTECSDDVAHHVLRDPRLPPGPVAIGRAVANLRLYLVDAGLQAVPIGVPGQLYVAGIGVGRGYLHDPRRTAPHFVPDPWSGEPGARAYRTGDQGRWRRDATIEFLGRADHQVKVRGVRIELGEVETALLAHPGVVEAAVVAVGEGAARRLVAFVATGAEAGEELRPRLREHLAERLSDALRPAAIRLKAALPRLPTGKIDRRTLHREALRTCDAGPAVAVAPRGPIEETLAETFSLLLRRGHVGVHDDFFAFGGHSLLATQLVSRVRRLFDVELALRTVFEKPTVAALAAEIDRVRRAGQSAPPPPCPAQRPAQVPLSFAQQRLWFLERLQPGSSVYNMPLARLLQGRLDVASLAAALGEVVRRHEAVRTRFPSAEGRPRQEVMPPAEAVLPLVDLTSLPPPRRPTQARRRLRDEANRPFRLERETPLRSHVWRLAAAEHVLFVNTHHVASDGWSQGIFDRELAVLYAASQGGAPSPLPALEVQYADFAIWQRASLQGEALAAQLAYWSRRLEALEVLELPRDRPRPAVWRHRGASLPLAFPGELGRALRRRGGEAGASLYMVLLAAFTALLHRLSGQSDVAVGSPIANRRYEEVEGLIGFFVNTLVLRCRPRPRLPFRDFLAQVRELCLEAYLHQDLPFERLVEELVPERDLSRSPLFQVMLVLQNAPGEALSLPGLTVEPFVLGLRGTPFDLTVSLFETGGGIEGVVGYDAELFSTTTMVRFVRSFAAVLRDAAADPSRCLEQLSVLSPGERHQLLFEWNDTASPAAEGSLLAAIEAQARRTPDAVAVSDPTARLTYAELDAAADRVGRHLAAAGVAAEDVVALLAERGVSFLAALLGILKAGGVYLPLDPDPPAPRLAQMWRQAAPRHVLVAGSLEKKLEEVLATASAPRQPRLQRLEEVLARPAPGTRPRPAAAPGQLAYVLFTSGSTGRPKAAMVTLEGLDNHLRAKIRDLGLLPSDVIAQTAAQSFDTSVGQLLPALIVGGRVHVVPPEAARDPRTLLRELDRAGVTVLEAVPSYLEAVAAELERRVPPPSRLRWVLSLGETLPGRLARRWRRACPAARLVNAYGPAECSVGVTHHEVTEAPLAGAPVAIGRASANLRFYLTDRNLRLVARGVAAELCIAGAGVGRGYHAAARRTAPAFVPDPFGGPPGGRLYRTGDLGRWRADGTVELLGRIDHQVKIRGVRVELGEVEATLSAHPAVAETAVVAVGEGAARRLAAFVVPAGDAGGLEALLREHLTERLPDVLRPARIRPLAALPRRPSGKLDRRDLERRASEDHAPAEGAASAPPRTEREVAIAEIFSELLARQAVGRHDDFFRLGGHSLLAVVLTARIERRFGVRLPLALLFQHPTVAALAAATDGHGADAASPLVAVRTAGGLAPLFCVHPSGGGVLCYAELARHLGEDQPFYALQARGYEDGEAPHDELPAMAADYLAVIRRRLGEAPRRLAGWSFGGVVAFEMARQLRSEGHPVETVALVDAPAPGFAANDGDGEPAGGFANHVHRSCLQALRRYAPEPYDGELALFRAERSLAADGSGREAGWGAFARRVEVRLVPGDHFTIMEEPHVAALAAALRAHLAGSAAG